MFAATPPPVLGSSVAVQRLIESEFSDRFEVKHINTAFGSERPSLGRITPGKILRLIGHYEQLAKVLRSSPYDIVITVPTFDFPMILRDVMALIVIGRLSHAKTIGWIHSSGLPRMLSRLPVLIRKPIMASLRQFDTFVALSEPLALQLRDVLPQKEVRVIPNGVGQTSVKVEEKGKDGNVRVVYLAHMIRAKGWQMLFEAAQKICLVRRNVLFQFYGAPGNEADRIEASKAFSDVGLDPRITYEGIADVEKRDWVFHNSQILCLPSSHSHEAQPLAILEAMAAGCAVVASCVGGIPGLVNQPNGGLLFDPGDADGLVKALLSLIDNPERTKEMGRFNLDQIRRRYSLDRVNAQWSKLINEIAYPVTVDKER